MSLLNATLAGRSLCPENIYPCWDGSHSSWTYECPDNWHMAGQFLLGYPTVSQLSTKELRHLTGWLPWIYIIKFKRNYQEASWLRICFLWQGHNSLVRKKCKWEYDQNPILNSKILQNALLRWKLPPKSLDSEAKVVLNNRIVLDYLLAE